MWGSGAERKEEGKGVVGRKEKVSQRERRKREGVRVCGIVGGMKKGIVYGIVGRGRG